MGLHPQADALVRAVESMGIPAYEGLSVEEGRHVNKNVRLLMIPAEASWPSTWPKPGWLTTSGRRSGERPEPDRKLHPWVD